tara:strand:+ start:71 stop:976 length:906 start_codon:yes stop_codon:yes gene_type:complete
MLLTIGVSYLLRSNSIDEFLISKQIKNFENYILKNKYKSVEIIYIIQDQEIKTFELLKENILKNEMKLKVKFIYGGKQGVAKSRNIAINEANGRFLLFFDIDCKFNSDISEFLDLLTKIRKDKNYLYFANKNNYKGKSFSFLPTIDKIPNLPKFLNHLAFAFIAVIKSPTYNIIVSPNFCKINKIYFDTNLGLGSYYKQSDEALFLINLFSSFIKKNINFNDFYMADIIDSESKSHEIKNELYYSLQSKGYVIRNGFNSYLGILAILPIAIFFSLKFYRVKSPFISFLLVMKGYILPRNFD